MNILSKIILFTALFLSILSSVNAQKLDEEIDNYTKKTIEFFNYGNYDSSLYYSNKIIEKIPKNSNAWLKKGQNLYFLNQDKEAIKALSQAIEINPQEIESYKYRATIYHLNGEHRKAIMDYDFYLKNNPTDNRSLAGKAKSHHRLKQYKQSINTYNFLLELDSDLYSRVLYLIARASVYMDLKKYEKAERDINEALKINVEPSLPLEAKSKLLVEKKEYQEALEVSQKVLKLVEKQENEELREILIVFAHGNIGYIKHKLGNTEEGIKDIMYSLELMPTNSYAYKHLALISFDLNTKEEGCQYIEKALELDFTKLYGDEMEDLKKEKCTN